MVDLSSANAVDFYRLRLTLTEGIRPGDKFRIWEEHGELGPIIVGTFVGILLEDMQEKLIISDTYGQSWILPDPTNGACQQIPAG